MQSLIHIRLTGTPFRANNRCFLPRVFILKYCYRSYEAQEPNFVGSWSKFIMKSTEWDLQSVDYAGLVQTTLILIIKVPTSYNDATMKSMNVVPFLIASQGLACCR